MDRTIFHCDCNGFYASVECLLDPSLKDIPMAVCGNPEHRHGIILAKNELAKGCGVRTAETIYEAKKKCPGLTLVPPHRGEYTRISKLVNDIYARFTDRVEPFGIDESWLDVTGCLHLFGTPQETADLIRKTVREELGITISVGVSFNKIFAKLGSDYKKPDATTVISRENYRDIVWPLPASALLYVGKAAEATLASMGVHTIGELACADEEALRARLGKMGQALSRYARGEDDSPVRMAQDEQDIKSVGNGMTFRRNLVGEADIRTGIAALSDSVAGRLRRHGVKCATVQVIIRDPAFHSISRQRKLDSPTNLAAEITSAAMELIKRSWSMRAPVRMLTVTGADLIAEEECGAQMTLFADSGEERRERRERLERTMDDIRGKFGGTAIVSGAILKNDLGLDAPDDSPASAGE